MWLGYETEFKKVVHIIDNLLNKKDELSYVECFDDFTKESLDTYNIRLLDDNSILSELKPLAERKVLQLEKENQQQGIELSEREIQEIIQGTQISELEIQLLELQGGI